MALTTHRARVTGPVAYRAESGKQASIPLGPCLVEQGDGERVDIVWGTKGENSAALPWHEFEDAANAGHLVLLD